MSTEIFTAVVERSLGHESPDQRVLNNEAVKFFESRKDDTQNQLRRHIAQSHQGWSIQGETQKPSFFAKFTGKSQVTLDLHLVCNNQPQGKMVVEYHPHNDTYSLTTHSAITQLHQTSGLDSWGDVLAAAKTQVGAVVVGVQPDVGLLDDVDDVLKDISGKLKEQKQHLEELSQTIEMADWRSTHKSIKILSENEESLPLAYGEIQNLISNLDLSTGLPSKILQTVKQSGNLLRTNHLAITAQLDKLKNHIRLTDRQGSMEALQGLLKLYQTHYEAMDHVETLLRGYESQRIVSKAR
ncbi:hypothetical protein HYV86_01300 [Candidatus Woesearchaeota archaeon]|nr:hypothetical protein [Candidatus Woesearchaeota archaeon]